MAKLSKEKYLILAVDDLSDHSLLVRMAVGKTDRLHFIGCASNGEELVAYLRGSGKYADRTRFPMPERLVFDFIVRRDEGLEVVDWLQTQPFEDMVVVVLSGSHHVPSVTSLQAPGTNYFQMKQGQLGGYTDLIDFLRLYLAARD